LERYRYTNLVGVGYLTMMFQLQPLYGIERDVKMVMNGEYVRIQNKAVMAYFKALTWRKGRKPRTLVQIGGL
jgi:hypothetical protein